MAREKNTIPMTRKIIQDIQEKIRNHTLQPGERLPSARELAAEYGVSFAVCHSVYRQLAERGELEMKPGAGTFVSGIWQPESAGFYFYNWLCVLPPLATERFLQRVAPEIELQNLPSAEYKDNPEYMEWIARLGRGTEKQVGFAAVDEGQLPHLAQRRALLPLDELLEKSTVLKKEYFPPEVLRAFRWYGKLYALPVAFSTVMLFYNRRLFRRFGLAEPTAEWSWEDLRVHLDRLTVRRDDQIVNYALSVIFTLNSYIPFLFQNDAEFLDRNGNCVIYDDPAAREALNFFAGIFSHPGTCSLRRNDPRSALVDLLACDRTAMLIGEGTDYRLLCERMPREDWGVVTLPGRKRRASSLSVSGVGLTAGARVEERFALLERMLSAPACDEYCREIPAMPAYHPGEGAVPPNLAAFLKIARPSLLSSSCNVVKMMDESLSLLLAHRLVLEPEQYRELQERINAGIGAGLPL